MDTPVNELSHLSWKDEDIEDSLIKLRQYVEAEAQGQIDWYYAKKTPKARLSSGLRLASILLTVIGGLVPIVKATLPAGAMAKLPFDFSEAGYLLIGLAAGCFGLDRFFGVSSGWIRYITAAMALEKAVAEYRLGWVQSMAKLRGKPPDAQQLEELIQTCTTFSLTVKNQVEQETKAWVTEFQSNLAQLEKDLQSKADEVKEKGKAAAAGA
jgi:hypothetical protein